jgi:hypothetical protein
MLKTHLLVDEGFQRGVLERLAGLEKDAERDAELRMLNGHGHHPEIPPPPKVPRESLRPWWGKDPWRSIIRYAGIALAGLLIGYLARHLGLVPPGHGAP